MSLFPGPVEPLPVTPDRACRQALADLGANVAQALATVATLSPYLAHLMADGERVRRVLATSLDALAAGTDVTPSADLLCVGAALRRAKSDLALGVALADLLGRANVATVTGALSAAADHAIRSALASALLAAERKGVRAAPETSGLIVIAMGKLGGGELNYSSDVDLVAFHDPERAQAAGIGSQQAVRLVQTLSRLLQERTADGYVFRCDLRLRPDPGATPVAVSTPAAIAYYQTRARAWERQAMIKARLVAGDIAAGTAYLAALQPSLWRSAYDFTVIDETIEMRTQIAAVRGAGEITLPGHNVKVGRGGIREIEFFAQGLQRLAGARDRTLRGRATVPTLARLARAGWIDFAVADELTDAYESLRRVEHRLQMVADEQTHTLPEADGFARLSAMMRDETLADTLHATFRTVHRHFLSLDGLVGQANPLLRPVAAREVPDEVGTAFAAALQEWRTERPAFRHPAAREHLSAVADDLSAAIAASAEPLGALAAVDDFFARLPSGLELTARLDAHRELIPVLVLIAAAAPRLSADLARRSHLLDVLIDPAFFGTLPDVAQLEAELSAALRNAPDYEAKLDALRVFGQEQLLLVNVRILTGSLIGAAAAQATTRLADVLVRYALALATDEFAARHGRVPGGQVALLALGKFGSGEMTATSDLDMVFLYGCAEDAGASDGPKSLSPGHYFTRLAQRLVAALSAPTARGALYEVDLRLRPSGRAGPLATHIRSFANYHAEGAWTFEHMALTRARVVAGAAALGAEALRIVNGAMGRHRDARLLAREVASMRARMEEARPGDGLKHAAGGQVDVEFLAQYLQLAHGLTALGADTSTRGALERARAEGALPADAADALAAAYRLYQRLSQLLAIASAGPMELSSAPAALQRLLVRAGEAPDIAFLEADVSERRTAVRALFEALLGPVERDEGAA